MDHVEAIQIAELIEESLLESIPSNDSTSGINESMCYKLFVIESLNIRSFTCNDSHVFSIFLFDIISTEFEGEDDDDDDDSTNNTILYILISTTIVVLITLCVLILYLAQNYKKKNMQNLANVLKHKMQDIEVLKEAWKLNAKDIRLVKLLSSGSYGSIWFAKFRTSHVAVKILKRTNIIPLFSLSLVPVNHQHHTHTRTHFRR